MDSPPSSCSSVDCSGVPRWHPVIVLINTQGARVEVVCGIRVCDACHARVKTPGEILSDGGAAIREALEKAYRTRIPITRLEWTPVGSKLARTLDKLKGS